MADPVCRSFRKSRQPVLYIERYGDRATEYNQRQIYTAWRLRGGSVVDFSFRGSSMDWFERCLVISCVSGLVVFSTLLAYMMIVE